MPSIVEKIRHVTENPQELVDRVRQGADKVRDNAAAVRVLSKTGMFTPSRLAAQARNVRRHGPTSGATLATCAELTPDEVGIVDEEGSLTWAELDRGADAIAVRLAQMGRRAGRQRRASDPQQPLVRAWPSAAPGRVAARILYANTGFAGPQLADVLDREQAVVVIADDEFDEVVDVAAGDRHRLVAHTTGPSEHETLADVIARPTGESPPETGGGGGQVVLTSGTTGTPKGAQRSNPRGDLVPLASMFSRIPHRVGDTMVVAAPMFHSWGLGNLTAALALGISMVTRRRFDPAETIRLIAEHRATTLVAVPVMLQRMLEVDASVREGLDLSSLRIVTLSGSALPGSLATQWMDAFGDNLYNTFGSTEVALATIADPADLRAAPTTAGRPPLGSDVALYDDDGNRIDEPGSVGRIFVGNGIQFEGYTGGGSKESIDGLLSIGDLGHFDAEGRLFVGGRDDDMIVSGGENVFPREVENLLADHPDVADVAVLGVEDAEFGQRLVAFVVAEEGTSPDPADLKAHVKSNLANYKVPRDVHLIDELPRNPTGKVLLRELRERVT